MCWVLGAEYAMLDAGCWVLDWVLGAGCWALGVAWARVRKAGSSCMEIAPPQHTDLPSAPSKPHEAAVVCLCAPLMPPTAVGAMRHAHPPVTGSAWFAPNFLAFDYAIPL